MKRTIYIAIILLSLTMTRTKIFAQVPSYIPSYGLIAWYPFNGNANDESGNSHNGAVSGATLTTDRCGIPNRAYHFHGVSDSIVAVISALPVSNHDRSFSIWFLDSTGVNAFNTNKVLIDYGLDGSVTTNSRNCLMEMASNAEFIGEANDACVGCPGNTIYYNPGNVADSQWHNFIVTLKTDTLKGYMDGRLSFQFVHVYNTALSHFKIGYNNAGWHNGEPFEGQLDDIGIWSRALTDAEITGIFAGIAPILGQPRVCISDSITLTDATAGGNWTSGNPAAAAIGSTGVVTGIASGTAVISYTVASSCGTATATKTIISSGPVIATIAGHYSPGGLDNLKGLAIDGHGNIYYGYDSHGWIMKLSPTGTNTMILCCQGWGSYSGEGGPATSARVSNSISGIAVDKNGNVFFADVYNNSIFKVSTAGIITRVAGTGVRGYNGDGIPATDAQLYFPCAVAVDTSGNIYIADEINSRIRKINPAGIISTFAGNGIPSSAGDGGPATAAKICYPTGVATDKSGNVFFADSFCVRKISAIGIVTTVAGNRTWTGPAGGGYGGPATSAQLFLTGGVGMGGQRGLSVDTHGNLYVGDESFRIFKIDNSGIITIIAGNDTLGYSGDGGPAIAAEISLASGLAVDTSGNVIFTDQYNSLVREIFMDCHPVIPVAHVSAASEVKGVETFNLEVYPNPNKGRFMVKIQSPTFESAHLIIMNIAGEKMMEMETSTNDEIPVVLGGEKRTSSGVYFISAATNSYRYFAKMIVE